MKLPRPIGLIVFFAISLPIVCYLAFCNWSDERKALKAQKTGRATQ